MLSQNKKVKSIESIHQAFGQVNYICTKSIATAVHLGIHLNKPILVEGPPGVGKTELAKAVARILEIPLIRLQCYEGLDDSKSLYEWKYGKQLLYTQILKEQLNDLLSGTKGIEDSMKRLREFDDIFYSETFLEPRPLLKALQASKGAVLLIDEIDKSDHEFEAFLLEILSEYQISIPEIGTIKAELPPVVFLTSNNTRELSEALRRRCLHLYIPFPEMEQEQQIIQLHVPNMSKIMVKQLSHFIQKLRTLDLRKQPAISETIDWAQALILMNATSLNREMVQSTLNMILKQQDDVQNVENDLEQILESTVEDRTTLPENQLKV